VQCGGEGVVVDPSHCTQAQPTSGFVLASSLPVYGSGGVPELAACMTRGPIEGEGGVHRVRGPPQVQRKLLSRLQCSLQAVPSLTPCNINTTDAGHHSLACCLVTHSVAS